MIHKRTGCVLDSDSTIIAHQTNCFKRNDIGFFKKLSERHPLAAKIDELYLLEPEDRLGTYSFSYIPETPLIIFNLYGQYTFGSGRNTDYKELSHALEGMFKHIAHLPYQVKEVLGSIKIGVPSYLGVETPSSWGKIYNLLDFYSREFKLNIHMYDWS